MIQDDDIFREVILKSWNLFDEKEEKQNKEQKEELIKKRGRKK
jgi:hypothetical protein